MQMTFKIFCDTTRHAEEKYTTFIQKLEDTLEESLDNK